MGIKLAIKRYKGPLIIFVVILFANLLFITGLFKSNPIDQFSGAVTFTHAGVYGTYSTIDPNNAYTTQALGHAGASDLLKGHMPWWNGNEQVGAPLAGGMQSAALFIPFNLLLAFSSGVLYFHLALELLAGIATYFLLRRLNCSEYVSTIGGILFALNGTFAWFGSANINPIAFLPLLILGIEIALDKTNAKEKGGWILIAIATAFSLYAGFPEAAYLDGLLAGMWFIVRLIQLRKLEWKKYCIKVFGGLFVGLLLAAPILVAFLDYLPDADIGGHAGAFANLSLPASTLPGLVMPYIFGPIFHFTSYDHTTTLVQFWDNIGGYITLTTLFLAIIGLVNVKGKNRAIAYMLGIFTVVVVARNYGFPGLSHILNIIPGVRQVAFYRYVNPTIELATVVLAMFGLQSILTRKKADRVNSQKIIIAGLAVFLLILILIPVGLVVEHNLYLAPHHRLYFYASIAWGLGCVGAMLVSFFFFKKYIKVLIPLILLVDVLLMFIAPQLSAPRSTVLDLKPVQFMQHNLGSSRFYSIGYIMPNYGSYYGIASINTNNEPVPQKWTKYITGNLNSNVNPSQEFTGIDMLKPGGLTPIQAFLSNLKSYSEISVKYVVIRNTILDASTASEYPLKLVYNDGYYQIYQIENSSPIFHVADNNCTVVSADIDTATVHCSKPSRLVRNELYMNGWTVKVNGKNAPIQRYGDLFQSISLEKGASTVVFNFTPPKINFAYGAFAVGVVLILWSIIPIDFHKLRSINTNKETK